MYTRSCEKIKDQFDTMIFVDNPFIMKKQNKKREWEKYFKYTDFEEKRNKEEKLFKFGKDLMDNFSKLLIDDRQDELLQLSESLDHTEMTLEKCKNLTNQLMDK